MLQRVVWFSPGNDDGVMKTTRASTRVFVIGVITAFVASALPACSAMDEVAHKVRSEHFTSTKQLAAKWDGTATWVPTDGTDIRVRESTVARDAVILVTSEAALDPVLCPVVDRQSAPEYNIDGAPDAYTAKNVYACGAWSVIRAKGGWLGWTPNHPHEQEQSPAQ